ncbi:molecular chaperone [Serratia fonticola]|uniref:fimbrial biogenesis chaperone n=1 Tax=Serratia fonticola TaxID=47917 RepID=UPI0013786D71|nr:molecular chaperone [Serratia fonticola]NCG54960.1 fimbria/pilus periplasmic chaperone [Serratia fonticola]
MKRLFPSIMLLLCNLSVFISPLAASATPETKGLSFYVLRVIYPESEKKGVTLTMNNKSDAPYLVQSRVIPVDAHTGDIDLNYREQPKMPFIVTPPLARADANSALTLRIRRNGDPLPTDRESVFFISMKAIPAKEEAQQQAATGRIAVTVVSNMKLFYRPEGLARRAVADVASKLRFHRESNTLIAENPTPYWLTFSRLSVGSTALDKPALRLMVPPDGQQRYTLPPGTLGKVSWTLIDEEGWDTSLQQHAL